MMDEIPRIEQEDMPAALSDYLAPRVARLGYLGEMFKASANTPDVLLAFMHFTDALKEALPFDIAEVAVLTVASIACNRYELYQHERLCARQGWSNALVAEVEALDPAASTRMSAAQRAVQTFAIAMLEAHGRGSQDALRALREHLSAAQSMSFAFLIGRYITHAMIVNMLELEPPVTSIHAPIQGTSP